MTPEQDARLARRCAREAGVALLAERGRPGPDLGGRGDRLAHRLIVRRLREARPDDVILSEEAADDPARLTAERVWIVDPLDGTREYTRPGNPQWAVHVALWTRPRGLAEAAVALPAHSPNGAGPGEPGHPGEPGGQGEQGGQGEPGRPGEPGPTLGTDRPPVLPPPRPGPPRIAVSRSRAPELARHLARQLGAELVPLGSAGFKVAAVLLGLVDAYVHAGGQYQWDSAAPVAVARAAGAHASRLDGAELRYNVPDLYVPDLLVCRPEWAEPLLTEIARG